MVREGEREREKKKARRAGFNRDGRRGSVEGGLLRVAPSRWC